MSEIKFIVTGDLHWRGTNPKARIDSYRDALTYKLLDIRDLVIEHQVDGIIIPGDIFDTPGVSLPVIADLMTGLVDFASNSIPIYTIAGNHDLYGGNPQSEHRTPYGILSRAGLIRDIDHAVCINSVEKKVIKLTGKAWDAEITDIDKDYYTHKYGKTAPDVVNIHVTHGMLLDKSPGYELRHTLMSDVAEHPNAPDVLINGHIHDCQGINKIKNTLFINPGSIGRIKATEENINRVPQVALLTIPEDGEPFAELIPLKSAKPGIEVLSREHIEEEKKRKKVADKFLELLSEGNDRNYQDMAEIMTGIADNEKLPPHIVKEGLRRLEEAREETDDERRAG